jgi:hypothetical protein
LIAFLVAALSGCTEYAQPSSDDVPSELLEALQGNAATRRVAHAISAANSDWCPSENERCLLDVRIGFADGVEALYARHAIWLPKQIIDVVRNDAELALLIGHEWTHGLLGDSGGFDAGRELTADCVGSLVALRSGYDPRDGVNLYKRLAGRKDFDEVMLGLGLWGGGINVDWTGRIAIVDKARAPVAGRPIGRADIEHICGVKL